jgi:hypothetical protein
MSDPAAPAWVHKRDGRLVPFEADKISRALFAASEELGRPDAFLARELADGIVHFLAVESEGGHPSTGQIEEVVVKVVRELGQPALAGAFADFARRRVRRQAGAPVAAEEDRPTGPAAPAECGEVVLHFGPDTPLAAVLAACARSHTLQTVFTRDLAAAVSSGLLLLAGLEAPGELAGCVLGPPIEVGADLPVALEEARRFAGRCAVDGPEHLLAGAGGEARVLAEQVRLGLRRTGLHAVVNLNSAAAPSWAGALAEGPLFAGPRRPAPEQLAALADALLEELLRRPGERLRVDWHLGEPDFLPAGQERLLRLARGALEGAALGFVFDRPRRPAALAEGLDRQHPAALLTAGLNLPALARQPGMADDPDRFLQRLGSLARLALSAAVQKRDHLRRLERSRRIPFSSGFLLDKARLVVAPLGLDAVVTALGGRGLGAGGAALDLGRRIVARLRDVLRSDGRSAQMDTCLDGPFDFALDGRAVEDAETVAGLTPWDAAASVKAQVRAGGVLHGVADHGTLALFVPADLTPDGLAEWLRSAWQGGEVVRLRLVRPAPAQGQLAFGE